MAEHVLNDPTLFVVPGGALLHTAYCPHLEAESLHRLVAASDQQIGTLRVCSSCQPIRDGQFPRRYDTFDEALDTFGAPLANRPMMREVAAGLVFSVITIPASKPYIAVAPALGVPNIAYFSKGLIELKNDSGGYDVIRLPEAGPSGLRSGLQAPRQAKATICPACFQEMPTSTGVCDNCA